MRKIAFLFTSLLAILLITPYPATAQVKNPVVTPVSRIQLPRIEAGNEKTISEAVDRDLIVAGGQLNIVSKIEGDAYIAGGQIDYKGTTTGNLIIGGGNITISGNVGKNLIVAGGQVKVDETARISGYVLAAGGQIILNGNFAGPVKVATGKLQVGEKAVVTGNLDADAGEATIAETASISGEKNIRIREEKSPEVPKKVLAGIATVGGMIYAASLILSLIVLVSLVKSLVPRAAKIIKNFWNTLGIGALIAVATPILAIAMMMTLIGLPIGLITFGAYLTAAYISSLVVAAAIGGLIAEKGWLKTKNPYLLSIVGLIVVGIAVSLPLVGWVAKFIVGAGGMGIIFRLLTTNAKA